MSTSGKDEYCNVCTGWKEREVSHYNPLSSCKACPNSFHPSCVPSNLSYINWDSFTCPDLSISVKCDRYRSPKLLFKWMSKPYRETDDNNIYYHRMHYKGLELKIGDDILISTKDTDLKPYEFAANVGKIENMFIDGRTKVESLEVSWFWREPELIGYLDSCRKKTIPPHLLTTDNVRTHPKYHMYFDKNNKNVISVDSIANKALIVPTANDFINCKEMIENEVVFWCSHSYYSKDGIFYKYDSQPMVNQLKNRTSNEMKHRMKKKRKSMKLKRKHKQYQQRSIADVNGMNKRKKKRNIDENKNSNASQTIYSLAVQKQPSTNVELTPEEFEQELENGPIEMTPEQIQMCVQKCKQWQRTQRDNF